MDAALGKEVRTACCAVLKEPVAGKGAILDLREGLLHDLLHFRRDDAGARHVVAVLCRVADGTAHLCHAALIHEVNDELHLMEALEISDLRLITCLDESLETVLDEMGYTAAEDNLLAEEIRLRLLLESGLDDACTGAANAAGIGQGNLEALARCILLHSEHIRNTAAFRIGAANEMAGTLRGNHEDIHVLRRNNLLEMDIEAMSKGKSTAGLEVRLDIVLVDIRLLLIGNQNHRDIRLLHSCGNGKDLESMTLSCCLGLAALIEADNDIDAALLEIQCMCMALAAISNDGNRLAIHDLPVYILVIISFCHSTPSPHNAHRWCARRVPARSGRYG